MKACGYRQGVNALWIWCVLLLERVLALPLLLVLVERVLNVVVAAMEVLLAIANLRSREEELAVTSTNGDAQMLVRFGNGEDGGANGALL